MSQVRQILDVLKGYSYNAMEICRILNGLQPREFRGCYYQFDINRRGPRCRSKERSCTFPSSSVDARLRRMEKKGLIHSVKIRWFDGRSKGAFKNSLQLDVFRFYYIEKQGLAARLKDDIKKHLETREEEESPPSPNTSPFFLSSLFLLFSFSAAPGMR